MAAAILCQGQAEEGRPSLAVEPGDRLVLLGGTLAERLQHFGWLEVRLQLHLPGGGLSLRNLGWSGDEAALMPRPLDFGDLETHLEAQRADVILLCFGANESFAGEAGAEGFRRDLAALVERLRSRPFNGESPPRLALVSPAAHEQLGPPWPDAGPRNVELERYAGVTREVAARAGLPHIDLFYPLRSLMAENAGPQLTINGIHFNDAGYRVVSEILAAGLGATGPLPRDREGVEALRSLVVEKDRQFFLRWRPVNAEYVFGRRKEPFGVLTYPPEMETLDGQIGELEALIQSAAVRLAAEP